MAAQNSILWWSSAHRVHHNYVDRDWDPYNIQRGFWWAHILWIFYKNDPRRRVRRTSPDLLKNPIVHVAAPLARGDPASSAASASRRRSAGPSATRSAGLLWGGFLRLVVIHHTTFFVNSLAHMLGTPAVNAEGLGARQRLGRAR